MIVQPTLDDRAACEHPPRVPRFGVRQRTMLRLLGQGPLPQAAVDRLSIEALRRLATRGYAYSVQRRGRGTVWYSTNVEVDE